MTDRHIWIALAMAFIGGALFALGWERVVMP